MSLDDEDLSTKWKRQGFQEGFEAGFKLACDQLSSMIEKSKLNFELLLIEYSKGMKKP